MFVKAIKIWVKTYCLVSAWVGAPQLLSQLSEGVAHQTAETAVAGSNSAILHIDPGGRSQREEKFPLLKMFLKKIFLPNYFLSVDNPWSSNFIIILYGIRYMLHIHASDQCCGSGSD